MWKPVPPVIKTGIQALHSRPDKYKLRALYGCRPRFTWGSARFDKNTGTFNALCKD